MKSQNNTYAYLEINRKNRTELSENSQGQLVNDTEKHDHLRKSISENACNCRQKDEKNVRVYVVYLGGHSHGIESSSVDLDAVAESHYDFLGSFLGSHEHARESMFYSYTRHINGFAANLDDKVAAEIARHPKVISVFLNKGRKLHTTRSWEFLGLEQSGFVASNSIWNKARYGEDTIIGNLDTGETLSDSLGSGRRFIGSAYFFKPALFYKLTSSPYDETHK
ncbi:hypothetical protein F3Y22_tig00110925pilonHSYRG00008 [Hibiscus syriacus]|uniref:Inhibitor I9 domain-containing protein n=1 Tax=Hibiscus syriacus TaxID=106335 RepID=A0A6A2ZEM4_HIBSY|nr:hypothetical protein F3Y22_tig00110925pilonHSYRG00008 [Hibiscus syriacus]